jgi:hypothetical protein
MIHPLRKRLAAFDPAALDLTAQMVGDSCDGDGVALFVRTPAHRGMVTALVSGYVAKQALDPRAVEREEIGRALEALGRPDQSRLIRSQIHDSNSRLA